MQKCPNCGYVEQINVKPHTHSMNRYVLKADPKQVSVFNHEDKEITVTPNGKPTEVWVREDIHIANEEKKALSALPQSIKATISDGPTVPSTPTPTPTPTPSQVASPFAGLK